jgi:hypothetical protein
MGTTFNTTKFIHPLLRGNERESTFVADSVVLSSEGSASIQETSRLLIQNDLSYGRSSRFEAILQASIAQAQEMGREMMWHDSYTTVPSSERLQAIEASREPIEETYSGIARGTSATDRCCQSSSFGRPRLHRRITNESTIPVPPDTFLWSDFLLGKSRAVSHAGGKLCNGKEMIDRSPDDLPRHVDVSESLMDDDSVSCLDDDSVDSSSSIDSTILNDFLYGDSMNDNDIEDDQTLIPPTIMNNWRRMAL